MSTTLPNPDLNNSAPRTGLLLVGHGSRDAAGNAEFEDLVERYRAAHPGLDVAHGYVEIAEPSLAAALAALAERNTKVIVVPLFLFAAGHMKNDIPLVLEGARRSYPDVEFCAARALGVHPNLVGIAYGRIADALGGAVAPKTAVILVGRGSSDPDANGDFCKVARLVGEGRGFTWVLPSFIGIASPSFEEAAEQIARSRPDRLVVAPYFLFGGRLAAKLESQVAAFAARYPWIRIVLAERLGAGPKLVEVLDERVRETLEGARPLPCDTCQYRTPISGIAGNVGGLRALLWSIRHGFTHTQAVPHVHAHRPLAKHILICENIDCAARGSLGLISAIRRLVKEAGRELDIRVTRTGCMGRCGEGPTVAVYPDGIWYRNVQEQDAEELVNEHLLNDRLVARLVDNIMQ